MEKHHLEGFYALHGRMPQASGACGRHGVKGVGDGRKMRL